MDYEAKRRCVQENGLCNKCLDKGHISKSCPKTRFRCLVEKCGGEHHTLMHRPPKPLSDGKAKGSGKNEEQMDKTSMTVKDQQIGDNNRACNSTKGDGGSLVGATGGGDESKVCLGVLPVQVYRNDSDEFVETYALMDNGSEVTLCHEQLAERLGLVGKEIEYTLTGMTGSTVVEGKMVSLTVKSMDEATVVELSNVKTVKRMPISPSCIPKSGDLSNWAHLDGIEIPELENGEVMLLIGVKERPSLFLPLEYKMGEETEPVAIKYSLGWTVIGPVGGEKTDKSSGVNLIHMGNHSYASGQGIEASYLCTDDYEGRVDGEQLSDDVLLSRGLERLWNTDFADTGVDISVKPSIEDLRALEIMENSLTMVDGHYQVALPWREECPSLPNNKEAAERRLNSLKTRLMKDLKLLGKYKTAMEDYINKGHAQKIPAEELDREDRPVWYLPHHPVTHPMKPEKVRVVFDCAAKHNGTSLNEQLLQGPDLANSLVGVLIRFREEPVALVADIEGMFSQIRVDPKDCDALRFLWWEDAKLETTPIEYRMVKHVFGATSSPSCANLCVKKIASLNEGKFDPETVKAVERNMYVDDLMKSVPDVQTANRLVAQLIELMKNGGFRLTKWISNDRQVLVAIPESEKASSVVSLNMDDLPTECALGLKWNVEKDEFVWEVQEKMLSLASQTPATRRAILSIVSSLFDPLGLLAPYLMKAKLLLQELCRNGAGWDAIIDENVKQQWVRWLEDLPKLEETNVKRCFKPRDFGVLKEIQLHIFSDGSRVGYGAVAYLRLVDQDDAIHCCFVLGKARVAPIREITIPRLELSATVISVKLNRIIQNELDSVVNSVTYWTDSQSVLKCICNELKRFHTFESNRLTIIHNGSSVDEWRYVSSEDNPADDASKGLKLDEMVKGGRWLNGPDFLWKDESCWPAKVVHKPMDDDDPALRKGNLIYVTSASESPLESLVKRYSSWWKLKRAVAWLLRYRTNLKKKAQQKAGENASECDGRVANLTVAELQKAKRNIIRHVQSTSFPEVIKMLSSQPKQTRTDRGKVLKDSSLRKLNPELNEDMLVVGGRLKQAEINDEAKHQMILPYKHRVTDLVIEQCHIEVGHMGQESVLSALRERYWIIKGRSAVRKVITRCLECQKKRCKPGKQLMADLPKDRVTPYKPPFTAVGVDYFRPLEVKQRRSRVKRYGCIFTCLAVRAVHIEIAHSLDTDSMINALRRFISIRGCPEIIRSDCGTNFKGADKELSASIQQWNQENIENFCNQKGIQWLFNSPNASHCGGAWERMIRSTRKVLRALMKEQVVCDEVLSTVMAEAMNILNSRPLTRNSDDPSDEQPITPNHLLKLRPCSTLPPGIFDNSDLHTQRRWRQVQYMVNLFWKRWLKEYLPYLQERQKWNSKEPNLKVDDLVLVMDENYPRGQWPVGRVVEMKVSEDGLVRAVNVKTSSTVITRAKRQRRGELKTTSTVLTRPIQKLCRLEME